MFLDNYRLFGGVSSESCADPDEVDRVCKVIDELFALDRNTEEVLDEFGVMLSHDLVVDVLHRFKHARKPAFRFFCWAGKRCDLEKILKWAEPFGTRCVTRGVVLMITPTL
jgi:hypothetical protein